MRASGGQDALAAAVEAARAEIASSEGSALDRAKALSSLLALLQQEVVRVTADRDEALREVLAGPDAPSRRELARQIGLSKARVDLLARMLTAGGRERNWRSKASRAGGSGDGT